MSAALTMHAFESETHWAAVPDGELCSEPAGSHFEGLYASASRVEKILCVINNLSHVASEVGVAATTTDSISITAQLYITETTCYPSDVTGPVYEPASMATTTAVSRTDNSVSNPLSRVRKKGCYPQRSLHPCDVSVPLVLSA